jgi:anthranilate phosphoribosyltransferase
MVLMNAAAAFMAAGLDNNFQDGVRRAEVSIDSGQAKNKLDQLIAFSQECRPFLRKAI